MCWTPAFIWVTVNFTSPSVFEDLGKDILEILSMIFVDFIIGLFKFLCAAWLDVPLIFKSNTINPFSAIAISINVGSPIIASSISGKFGITLFIPWSPDLSSSAEAKRIILKFKSSLS